MKNAPLLILAVVGLIAILGLVMQFTSETTGELYYQYQSPVERCIRTCEERYVPGYTMYNSCVQDCLPPA